MAEVASAFVSLVPSVKGFGAAASKGLNPELKAAGASGGSSLGSGMSGAFSKKVKEMAAGLAAAFTVDKAIDFFKESVASSREAAKVAAITANVIKTTGGAAKISASGVEELTTSIANKTGVDRASIVSGANMLLTFTRVRDEVGKGNDIFTQGTQAATDLSVAMGSQPRQAALQLGKALNDPVKGVTALMRVGVSFTAQQKAQIKTLVASGNTLGAQKIILGEVQKEFGGTAAAAGTNADRMKVAFTAFKETVGGQLTPVLDKVEGIITTKILPAVQGFITGIQNGTGAGGKFASVVTGIWGTLSSFFGLVAAHRTTVLVMVAAMGLLAAVTAVHAAALAISSGALMTWFTETKVVTAATKVWAAVQWLMNAALTANPIGLVIAAVALLVGGIVLAYQHSETFRKIVHTAFHDVAEAGKWMWNTILKPTFRFLLAAFITVAGGIVDAAATAFGWIPGLGGKLKTAAANFHTWAAKVSDSLNTIPANKSVTISAKAQLVINSQKIADAYASGAMYRAAGGPIKGPGTGTSDTAGLWALSNDEHVVTAAEVAGAGGHRAVEAQRAMWRAGIAGGLASGGRSFNSGLYAADAYDSKTRDTIAAKIQKIMRAQLAQIHAAEAAAGPSGPVSTGANVALGRVMAAARGWTGGQFEALNKLWTRESGWNNHARNSSSGAYGIPQGLPPGKMGAAAAGGNAHAQIAWGLQYIKDRYGSPAGAWAHEGRSGWYDQGGILPAGGIAMNGTSKPEAIFNSDQLAALTARNAAPSSFHLIDSNGVLFGTIRGIAQAEDQRQLATQSRRRKF